MRTKLSAHTITLALLLALGAGFEWRQGFSAESRPPGLVWLVDIDGAIGPATSHYIIQGIDKANEAGAALIVITMNTPGGLDQAMRDIIRKILASRVPVATFVSPKGARAASAGTYIAYASHIAAMAPATNLGAATPVQLGAPSLPKPPGSENGEEGESSGSSAMEQKMINDSSAYIIGLAELRGRNADWAELAVREAASLDAKQALRENVIDLIAEDLDDLLAQLDGRTLSFSGREVTLDLAEFDRVVFEQDLRTEILSIITNPGMILILGMIGMYGIILEFYNPGSFLPGVVGVICLLLAAYSIQLLPLNYAGLALLVFGIGLMVAEALIPSFGILGIGGIIAFSIGGLMLFDTEMEAFRVGLPTIAAIATVSALIIIATINIAMKVRRKEVTTGMSALIGRQGEALEDFHKEGQARIGGEIWRAKSGDTIVEGDTIVVETVDGLLLEVKKLKSNEV